MNGTNEPAVLNEWEKLLKDYEKAFNQLEQQNQNSEQNKKAWIKFIKTLSQKGQNKLYKSDYKLLVWRLSYILYHFEKGVYLNSKETNNQRTSIQNFCSDAECFRKNMLSLIETVVTEGGIDPKTCYFLPIEGYYKENKDRTLGKKVGDTSAYDLVAAARKSSSKVDQYKKLSICFEKAAKDLKAVPNKDIVESFMLFPAGLGLLSIIVGGLPTVALMVLAGVFSFPVLMGVAMVTGFITVVSAGALMMAGLGAGALAGLAIGCKEIYEISIGYVLSKMWQKKTEPEQYIKEAAYMNKVEKQQPETNSPLLLGGNYVYSKLFSTQFKLGLINDDSLSSSNDNTPVSSSINTDPTDYKKATPQ